MLAFTVFFQLHIYKLKNTPVAHYNEIEPKIANERAIRYTDTVLSAAVSALQSNDKLADDIFSFPVVTAKYRFSQFSTEHTPTRTFSNLHTTSSRANYTNLQLLSQLVTMLNNEFDLRSTNYEELEEYLEEQYVIFCHTPSIWPTPTERVTSFFGFRKSPFTGIPSYHEGTDFSAMTGTKIFSTADGIVVHAGTRTGYGYLVTIDHGFGYMTRYAHNSKLLVKVGDRVKKGDVISLSGSTGRSAGPHLHYEVLYNGTPVNSKKFLPVED